MEIMDDHDLLPTHNYKFGSHKDSPRIDSGVWKSFFTQNIPDGCWIGCNMACSKAVDDFVISTGPYKGQTVIVDGPEYETAAGLGSNGGFFDPRYIIETNFYCDTYGICTITWGTSLAFMQECYENGILNKERTGGPTHLWQHTGRLARCKMVHAERDSDRMRAGVTPYERRSSPGGIGRPRFPADIASEKPMTQNSPYKSERVTAQQGGYALTNKSPHKRALLHLHGYGQQQYRRLRQSLSTAHFPNVPHKIVLWDCASCRGTS